MIDGALMIVSFVNWLNVFNFTLSDLAFWCSHGGSNLSTLEVILSCHGLSSRQY